LDELINKYEDKNYILKAKNLDNLSKRIQNNLSKNNRTDIL
jgi:hypothetical protein